MPTDLAPALRLHHFLPRSRANGPGWRAVVWVQGCTLGCPGCFNPATHSFAATKTVPPAALAARIHGLAGEVQGVTISGGEPLQQLPAVTALLAALRRGTRLSTILFTGYTWEEAQARPGIDALLAHLDVLIAGRYEATRRVAAGLLGSTNKTLHFLTPRYTKADLDAVPEAEVIIGRDGNLIFSGIGPMEVNLD